MKFGQACRGLIVRAVLSAGLCAAAGECVAATPPAPWQDAQQYADGWLGLGWFGWFKNGGGGWIHHTEHAWLYSSSQSTASLWLYDQSLGCWWWTSSTVYPYLYRSGTGEGWYWYYRNGSPGSRWFHRFASGADVTEGGMVLPLAPSNLTVSNLTTTTASLGWKDNSSNESGFEVGTLIPLFPMGSMWSKWATVPANATTCTVTGLSPGTAYTFYVRAYNDTGAARSSGVTFTTPTGSGSVAAPTGLKITATTLSSVTLQWSDNATNETAYYVSLSTDGEGGPYTESAALPANKTTEPVTELLPCRTYWFKVRAANGSDYSSYSNIVSVNVDATAKITFVNSYISPFPPSLGYPTFVGCWNSSNSQGGLAMYDNEGNHVLESEGGSTSLVFPRQPQQAGAYSSEWVLSPGKKYDGSANAVILLRFSGWTSYFRDQFLALHLQISGGTVTPVSLWGGDMVTPVHNGTEYGIVMSGAVQASNLSISYGKLPGSEAGVLQGSAAAFIYFVAPALPGEGQVTYSADVYVDFNVPLNND